MNGKVKTLTLEQVKKLKSGTDWDRVRNQEPDLTDPDAPDFSDLMVDKIKRLGRPPKAVCKDMVNLRLDHFVLATLRGSGKGWQTRLSNYIAKGVKTGALK
jgi:uncharacterized protein (DUF4415 family)